MPKRGTKPTPAKVIELRGTGKAERPRQQRFSDDAEVPAGSPVKPKWLTRLAGRIWNDKVEIFQRRGQDVTGCEMALAQYCVAEAHLIECYKKGIVPTTAMVREHRMWAAEFFDTPASQVDTSGKGKRKGNAFDRNGRRPRS